MRVEGLRVHPAFSSIEADYTRSRESTVPTWLGRMGMFMMALETSRGLAERDGREVDVSLAGQMRDKISVLSQSLRICTEHDLVALYFLQLSVDTMWPGIRPYDGPADAKEFSDQVDNWLNAGISADAIIGFFECVGGIACLDPTIQRLFMSATDFVSELPPLAGTSSGQEEVEMSGQISGGAESGRRATLARFIEFSEGVAKSLSEKLEGGELGRKRASQIRTIMQSADYLAKFLSLVQRGGFKESRLERPNPYVNVITPVAAALTEALSGYEKGDFQSMREDIAGRMVRVFRRRRVALDRLEILGFCASFRQRGQVDLELLEKVDADVFAGYGLEYSSDLAIGLGEDDRSRDVILAEISENVIPEFIFQMRAEGYHTFDWNVEDYRALGLTDAVWQLHEKRLQEASSRVAHGPEVVGKGDLVIEMSGHWAPLHVAHAEAVDEVAEDMLLEELRRAGLLPKGFGGKIWLGMTTNPRKKRRGKDVKPDVRQGMAMRVLSGIDRLFHFPGVVMHTLAKLLSHEALFKEEMRELAGPIIRMVGTEKLGEDGLYTAEDEPEGYVELNKRPHIFLLQIEELNDLPGLFDRIRTILENFGEYGVMILLTPIPEVHSSFFVQRLHEISNKTLATLVHPSQVDEVRKLYGKSGSP